MGMHCTVPLIFEVARRRGEVGLGSVRDGGKFTEEGTGRERRAFGPDVAVQE